MRRFFSSTIRAAVGGVSGYLDGYIGARMAISTRLVYSSWIGNPCMNVTTDGVTFSDVGFSGNIVDEASLLSLAGGGDLFMEIGYDQSGNNQNWVASFPSDRPKIVSSGVIRKYNGIPLINFYNPATRMGYEFTGLVSDIKTFYFMQTVRTDPQIWRCATLSSRYGLAAQSGSTSTAFISASYGSPTFYKNKVVQPLVNRGDVFTMVNGESIIAEIGVDMSTWGTAAVIGRQPVGSFQFEGGLNDWIDFDTTISIADINGIIDAINFPYLLY